MEAVISCSTEGHPLYSQLVSPTLSVCFALPLSSNQSPTLRYLMGLVFIRAAIDEFDNSEVGAGTSVPLLHTTGFKGYRRLRFWCGT